MTRADSQPGIAENMSRENIIFFYLIKMHSYFKNKVALISGSSMGIGKELARQFLLEGASVVLNGRNEQRLKETEKEFLDNDYPVMAFAGDVSVPEDCRNLVKAVIERFGKIDILINNAGLTGKGSLETSDDEAFRKIMNVNVLGSAYLTKYALPSIKQNKGSVIFISSNAGICGLPYFAAYGSSKKALEALAFSLRLEVSDAGVHVGITYVGFTENDPRKQSYTTEGNLITMQARKDVKVMPVARTASLILRQIRKRKFRVIHSPLGKMNWALYRLFPSLVFMVMNKNLEKFRNG